MVMTEKRHSQRKPIALSALVSCGGAIADHASGSVHTLNLSKAGALIESFDPMFTGEVCTFTLMPDVGPSAAIRGHVIWVEESSSGAYHAGVAFRNLTPDEEYLLDLQLVRGAR